MKNLINTWLLAQKFDIESREYDATCWAIDNLFDLAHDDYQKLLDVIVEILKLDNSPKILGALGAGVLEDVLVHNGDKCITELMRLAESNANVKAALKYTYLEEGDVSPNVFKEFQKVKAT